MPSASVLIPAYNEEQNIGPLLDRIAAESDAGPWTLDDVIVVASGCTDATARKARAASHASCHVRVIVERRRTGKASAINVGLRSARHDVVLLVSGDVMPAPGAIPMLLSRLDDPAVGAVGGRPIPLNDETTFTGFAAHLMWRLHHQISVTAADNPKCGEAIAFRKALQGHPVVNSIPSDTAVDEVSIQALIHAAGLRSVYAPEAIIRIWGPATVKDWLTQRRRINTGHILASRDGYRPSTMNAAVALKWAWCDEAARRKPMWSLAVVALEAAARIAGYIDVARRRSHTVWRVATTTKRAIEQEAG